MAKYKFIKIKDQDNIHDSADVLLRVEADSCDIIIREFRYFLLGCGFGAHSITTTFRDMAEEYEKDIDLDLEDDHYNGN